MSFRKSIRVLKTYRQSLLYTLYATAAGWIFVLGAPAFAQVDDRDDGTKGVDFCAGVTDADCYTLQIKNVSSATVQSTDIDQNSTNGLCTKKQIKVKQNVTGNNSLPNNSIGPYLYAELNANCAYEVKFNVTDGCAGDTRARIKAGKQPEKAFLDKDCGSLVTVKKYG